MARAAKARSNKSDDIPIASRSSSYKRLSTKQLRFISFFAFALFSSIVAILVRTNLIRPVIVQGSFKGLQPLPSLDGRLLGHFPYPEAKPEDLVSVYPGLQVHKDTYEAMKRMRAAAASDGVQLVLLSGYRSHQLQKEIFFEIKSHRNQTAFERSKVSAPPGHSEHSTGYAIDLGDGEMRETDFEVEFASTKAFKWLQKNAARYHFTLSFPIGNAQGVSYEPWHWRYEGSAKALRQFEDARLFLEAL